MKLGLNIIIILFFIVNTVKAQHDHSSHDHSGGTEHTHKAEPPHGGEIKDVGKYHFEIVFDIATPNENMCIYLLKSNMKPIDIKDATGKVSVNYKNGEKEAYELTKSGVEKLFCNVKDIVNPFNAIIIINIKGKEYNCTYLYKGLK